MRGLFETLVALRRQSTAAAFDRRTQIAGLRGTRRYRCRCGRPVFFRNSVCTACGSALGYVPEIGRVLPLDPGPTAGLWLVAEEAGAENTAPVKLAAHKSPASAAPGVARVAAAATSAAISDEPRRLYARCANFDTAAGCNWLVALQSTLPAEGEAPDPASTAAPAPMLCRACRLNRTIPDLSDPTAAELWRRMELARRRLVSQLISIGLPVASKVPAANEDPERGLMFDVLRPLPGGPPVMTGHDDGLITLNLDEADDAIRERTRVDMREPYRTLLGHFRHEVGHYYWDRLVDGTPWIEGCRQLFGDDREDYAAALQRHYAQGAKADWAMRHVSSYASTHPWEDWAETWAHYLHMLDTLDTALSFGLDASDVEFDADPFTKAELWKPDDPGAEEFLGFVNGWVELTSVLNELSRSMGQADYYPFVLPRPVVGKLQFVHLVVRGVASATRAAIASDAIAA